MKNSLQNYRFLFLNDKYIARAVNIRRSVNQPTKYASNPALKPEYPWEMGGVSNYGTVHYDEQEKCFKFWYLTTPGGKPGSMISMDGRKWLSSRTLLCYATSKDGLSWERPSLGQVEYEGSKDNNILRIGKINVEGAAILYEPDDPDPARRYKALYWEHGSGGIKTDDSGLVLWCEGKGDGIWVSFSPNGITWTNFEGNPVRECYSDTCHYVVSKPGAGRYAAYGRFGFNRSIARMDSDDFVNWTNPESVLEPDEKELTGPYPDTQFYGMAVDLYENQYIGALWIFRHGTDGRINTQLAVSEDGWHWYRVGERETFLEVDPEGCWADGMVRPTAKFITRGDEILIFYGMVNGPHATSKLSAETIVRKHPGAIGLCKLRRDGFVSLDAESGGYVLTKPFYLDGRALHLNAQVLSGGKICVNLVSYHALDMAASTSEFVMPGFEESSEPIKCDSTDVKVSWPNRSLASLAGKVCRLRIDMKHAKLFSFWFK